MSSWFFGTKQKQSQSHKPKSAQRQVTTFQQRFEDQTVAVFRHLKGVLRMKDKPHMFDEDIINLSTDTLMDSLNLFAQNCYELHQARNRQGLDLAKKMVMDQWEALPDEFKTKKTMKYREFLEAALNENRLIQINSERMQTAHEKQLEREALKNGDNLNGAYSHLIKNIVKSDNKRSHYNNPQINDELEREQQEKLKEYRTNGKYTSKGKKYKDYNASNTSSFYFTKSGQNGKFTHSFRNFEDEKDEIGDVLMNGSTQRACASGDVSENGVIILSPNKRLNGIDHAMPCLVLSKPSKGRGGQEKYNIKLAHPYNSEHWVHSQQFSIKCASDNEKYVKQVEAWYMKEYRIKSMGYLAVDPVLHLNDCDASQMTSNVNVVRGKWINSLNIECKVDAFDGAKWHTATIVGFRKDNNKVKIHYDGFKDKYDEWINVWNEKKIAPQFTHTVPDVYLL